MNKNTNTFWNYKKLNFSFPIIFANRIVYK